MGTFSRGHISIIVYAHDESQRPFQNVLFFGRRAHGKIFDEDWKGGKNV